MRKSIPAEYDERLEQVNEELHRRKQKYGTANTAQMAFDMRYSPGLVGYLLKGKHRNEIMLASVEVWLEDPAVARRMAFKRCKIDPDTAVASDEAAAQYEEQVSEGSRAFAYDRN